MPDCKTCEYPALCGAFSTLKDHLAPDGEYRVIIGCDKDNYYYGELLTTEKAKEILTVGRAKNNW